MRKILAKQGQWAIGIGRITGANVITIPHFVPYDCYKLDDLADATSAYRIRTVSTFIVFKSKSRAYKYLYKEVKRHERKREELIIIIK